MSFYIFTSNLSESSRNSNLLRQGKLIRSQVLLTSILPELLRLYSVMIAEAKESLRTVPAPLFCIAEPYYHKCLLETRQAERDTHTHREK